MISRVKVLITGKNPDYFVKKIIQKKINIYTLDRSYRGVLVVIDYDSYKKVKEIKTTYTIKIVERFGLVKYQYLFFKYLIFICCFIFGVFLNIFLSCFIFKVEIIHSNQNIRELVRNDLESYGIKKFNFKVSFDKKEQIKEAILKKEVNDLEWLEIEEVGTKYIVKVEQRKKNKEEDKCLERNIVAKKRAMILDIEAIDGEVVKKKLDYVSKGDIIISGLIYNKEEVVAKRCAKGKVFGEVWYKVEVELPVNYYEENVTGKKKRQVEVQFLTANYKFFNTFKTYQKKVYPILESSLLPIKIQVGEYLETNVIDKRYTVDSVDEEAIKLALSKLKGRLGKEDEVISKKVLKKTKKDSKILVEVFFKVKEDITDYQDITKINIDELNKKKE